MDTTTKSRVINDTETAVLPFATPADADIEDKCVKKNEG